MHAALDDGMERAQMYMLEWYMVHADYRQMLHYRTSLGIHMVQKSDGYHRQYCRCAVTGRSGRGSHSGLFARFFLISSETRMRVFSSLSRTLNSRM